MKMDSILLEIRIYNKKPKKKLLTLKLGHIFCYCGNSITSSGSIDFIINRKLKKKL